MKEDHSEGNSDRHDDGNSDQHSDGNSEQNEFPGMQERTVGDYWRPVVNENYSRIRRQPVDANNFKLKASLISMVQRKQFGGHASKDPHGHISKKLEVNIPFADAQLHQVHEGNYE